MNKFAKALVRAYFDYDQNRDGLYWRVPRGQALPGSRFGGYDETRGYRVGRFRGHWIREEILLWNYFYGPMPDGHFVTIINPDDPLTIENLELQDINLHRQINAGVENKSSQYRGVSITKEGKITAQISYQNERHNLGTFQTEEDAARSYNEAAIRFHGDSAFQNEIEE